MSEKLPEKKEKCERSSSGHFYQNLSGTISNGLGNIFYRLGLFVALRPWKIIIASCLLVACCSIGLLTFHNEKNPLKLWIPQKSKFISDTDWIMTTVKEAYRLQSVLITAPNVLEPSVLQKVSYISNEVTKLKGPLANGTIVGWNDVCFKIPYIAEVTSNQRKKRDVDDKPFDPSVHLFSSIYCGIINSLPLGCYMENILELWKFDAEQINNLTKDDVLNALNTTLISPTTGHETDFIHLLGGIERNSSGHIVSAKSLLTHWMVYINFSTVDHDKNGNIAGTEDWASEEVLVWEGEYLIAMEKIQKIVSDNETTLYYTAGRSYGDISAATMFQDLDKLFIGGLLMFVYMEIVLSKFSWIELRIILGSMGLLSVGMAFISAIGICSLFGVSYGPVHTSLPFLLMGLGVDDIFVIMACWRQVESMNTGCSVPERMGLMLKHAGASITITSLTDVVAFLIGATTILPSLESFCIFAAVGIFLTYIFAITFVIAIFTLDQYRIEGRKNACAPCITHKEYKNELWCAQNLMPRALKCIYSKVIFSKVGKFVVLLTAAFLAGFGTINLLNLKQKFDPTWFIPARTYMHKYLVEQHEYYPDMGFEATIFMGEMNYTDEFPKILTLVEEIRNRTDIIHDVTSAWPEPFRKYIKLYYDIDLRYEIVSDEDWRQYLSTFLYSQTGGKFQPRFKFKDKLECGEPTPPIQVSTIEFKYRRFEERNVYVPAMHLMEDLVDNANLKGFATIWSKIYGNWITDEVIDTEVFRNIILALICVMACTFLLIANIQICFYIFVCVLLTLVNVCGFMEQWGLTIDLVSCIGLQLAVGLCVDYAAHIGHTFLTMAHGTRTERATETVSYIGAAVVYGGGSTLLALSMLSNSDAYTFKAFFRIFLLVIIFGLFHGLVFLPVLLSLIGPKPYASVQERIEKIDKKKPIDDTDDYAETISFIRPKETIANSKETNESTVNKHLVKNNLELDCDLINDKHEKHKT